MAAYEIKFSRPRELKGLKPWGVFEIVSPSFSRGLSQHSTKEEAEAALAELKGKGGQ